MQADGGAPRPLPLIAAGAAATGGAESAGGDGAVAVADGLLESPASRLLQPWARCPPLSLFADASGLSSSSTIQFACKLGAVPTDLVQGKSQHQGAQLDLGRVRSIVVEHAALETFNSSHSAIHRRRVRRRPEAPSPCGRGASELQPISPGCHHASFRTIGNRRHARVRSHSVCKSRIQCFDTPRYLPPRLPRRNRSKPLFT